MEYTVQKLAKITGVSARTLRYYDQIGLLCPARTSSNGYRIYGQTEVDRLQQILFYRELGMELANISAVLSDPDFDRLSALRRHLSALLLWQEQIACLITTVHKTIQTEMRESTMTDQEKFEGFKTKLLTENETRYGKEMKEKYGEDIVHQSNAKMMKLTREQYDQMESLGQAILGKLETAVQEKLSPESEAGQAVAQMHKEWLHFTWKSYTPEAHRSLGETYVMDERFTAYYDKSVPGCAAFLHSAICAWIK